MEPCTQPGGRGDLLGPHVIAERLLADAPRPQFIDQHPVTVLRSLGFVNPLDTYPCHNDRFLPGRRKKHSGQDFRKARTGCRALK